MTQLGQCRHTAGPHPKATHSTATAQAIATNTIVRPITSQSFQSILPPPTRCLVLLSQVPVDLIPDQSDGKKAQPGFHLTCFGAGTLSEKIMPRRCFGFGYSVPDAAMNTGMFDRKPCDLSHDQN